MQFIFKLLFALGFLVWVLPISGLSQGSAEQLNRVFYNNTASSARHLLKHQPNLAFDKYVFSQAFTMPPPDARVPTVVSNLVLELGSNLAHRFPRINGNQLDGIMQKATQAYMDIYEDSMKRDEVFEPNKVVGGISKGINMSGEVISLGGDIAKNPAYKASGELVVLLADSIDISNKGLAWFREEVYGDSSRLSISSKASGELAGMSMDSPAWLVGEKVFEVVQESENQGVKQVLTTYAQNTRGVNPTDSAEQILKNKPLLKNQIFTRLSIDDLQTAVKRINAKLSTLGEGQQDLKDTLTAMKTELNTKLDGIALDIENLQDNQKKILENAMLNTKLAQDTNLKVSFLFNQKLKDLKQAQDANDFRNVMSQYNLVAQTTVGLTGFLAKLDPANAQIYAGLGYVAKMTHSVVVLSESISRGLGDAAINAATGNVIGGVLSFAGFVMSQGQEDPTQAMLKEILSQLNSIAEQINHLGEYLGARLDHQDAVIRANHVESLTRSAMILESIQDNRERLFDIAEDLKKQNLELQNLSYKLYETHNSLYKTLKDGFNQDATILLQKLDRVFNSSDAAQYKDKLFDIDGQVRTHIFKLSRNSIQLGAIPENNAELSDMSLYDFQQNHGGISLDLAMKHLLSLGGSDKVDFNHVFPDPFYYQTWIQAYSRLYLKFPNFAKEEVSVKYTQDITKNFGKYLDTKCSMSQEVSPLQIAIKEYQSAVSSFENLVKARYSAAKVASKAVPTNIFLGDKTGNMEMTSTLSELKYPMPKNIDQLVPAWVKKRLNKKKGMKLRWSISPIFNRIKSDVTEKGYGTYYFTKHKKSWRARIGTPPPNEYKIYYEVREKTIRPSYIIKAYFPDENKPVLVTYFRGLKPIKIGKYTFVDLTKVQPMLGSKKLAKMNVTAGWIVNPKLREQIEAFRSSKPNGKSLEAEFYARYVGGNTNKEESNKNFYYEAPVDRFSDTFTFKDSERGIISSEGILPLRPLPMTMFRSIHGRGRIEVEAVRKKYASEVKEIEDKLLFTKIVEMQNLVTTVIKGGSQESLDDEIGKAALKVQVKFLVLQKLLHFAYPKSKSYDSRLKQFQSLPNHMNLHKLLSDITVAYDPKIADTALNKAVVTSNKYFEGVKADLKAIDKVPCLQRNYPMEVSTSSLLKRVLSL